MATSIACFLSFTESHLALFTASFETNPLDGKCDQRAAVSSQPVQVIYDAVSINLPKNSSSAYGYVPYKLLTLLWTLLRK